MSSAIEKALAKKQEMREAGIQVIRLNPIEKARKNPKSKALAIKAYYWDLAGRSEDAESRAEFNGLITAAKHQGSYAKQIKTICRRCVGDGADPNPPKLIRCCGCANNCPLHPVRPYQKSSAQRQEAV
jgi:hypothetical protein